MGKRVVFLFQKQPPGYFEHFPAYIWYYAAL